MIDDATARRLARELIGAAVAGEVPWPSMMQMTDPQDVRDVLIAVVRHARGLVRVTAHLTDMTPEDAMAYLAAMDWSQEDETPGQDH
jgi:hypothetical protein